MSQEEKYINTSGTSDLHIEYDETYLAKLQDISDSLRLTNVLLGLILFINLVTIAYVAFKLSVRIYT